MQYEAAFDQAYPDGVARLLGVSLLEFHDVLFSFSSSSISEPLSFSYLDEAALLQDSKRCRIPLRHPGVNRPDSYLPEEHRKRFSSDASPPEFLPNPISDFRLTELPVSVTCQMAGHPAAENNRLVCDCAVRQNLQPVPKKGNPVSRISRREGRHFICFRIQLLVEEYRQV